MCLHLFTDRSHILFYRFLEDLPSLFRGIRLNSGQALRRGSITLQISDLQLNDSTLNRHDDRFGPVCHTEFSWNTFQQNLSAGQPKNCKKFNFFIIYPNFLYGNTVKFFSGKVNFVLNGSISKTLVLPVQTVDLNPMRAAQSIPGTTTMYVGLNGVVEIRTNGINLTNSPSRVPAKWFISNF